MRKDKVLERFLVANARNGDRVAMAQLVKLRGARLLAHAARLLGDREGARDIVQDAWIEIFRGLSGLRDDSAFLSWALRIVTRRVARVIKTRQKTRLLAGDFAAEAETTTPALGEKTVMASQVRRAIASLPPDQAATIALFYLEDMRVVEVAVALDVPVGTIKTRLMHARTKLRAILEGDEDG